MTKSEINNNLEKKIKILFTAIKRRYALRKLKCWTQVNGSYRQVRRCTKKIEKCTERGDTLEVNVNFPTRKR